MKLVFSIIICQLVGVIGAFFTTPSIASWYSGLTKPSFNPPNWVFGPVWIVLYLLMGVSLHLVWSRVGAHGVKTALVVFAIQLVLNSLWSIIFFGLHQPFLAFLEIIVLWFFILLTLFKFFPISKMATYLLVPYLLWVSFASVLNFYIFKLN